MFKKLIFLYKENKVGVSVQKSLQKNPKNQLVFYMCIFMYVSRGTLKIREMEEINCTHVGSKDL